MLDLAAVGRFEDVAPRDFAIELFGPELDRAIEIQRGKAQMMDAVLHMRAS